MKKILIIGCGYVGKILAQRLLARGDRVWALQRHPVEIPGVQNILCDINRLTQDLLPQVDELFYLIPGTADPGQAALASLLAMLSQNTRSALKFIYVSSTSVYGQQAGEWVNESSKTEPQHASGKALLVAEGLVKDSKFENCIVRFGGIYGPGRERLIQMVRAGQVSLTPYPCFTNRVHVADCAGILMHLSAQAVLPACVLGVDCLPVQYNEMLGWLADQVKVGRPKQGMEVPERLKNSNKRCDNRFILSLGYHFQYPSFREGYMALL